MGGQAAVRTRRATHAIHVEHDGRRTWLPAGFSVHYCYPGADQDGLTDHAVCRTANGQLAAVPVDDLVTDDGKPFALPSRVAIVSKADTTAGLEQPSMISSNQFPGSGALSFLGAVQHAHGAGISFAAEGGGL